MDDKHELIRAFDDCIAAFPNGHGTRNCVLLPRAACLAVKMGMGEDVFIDVVRNVAPDMGGADVRRSYRTAARKIQPGDSSITWAARRNGNAANPPRMFPNYVRHLINAGRDVETVDALAAMSAEPIADSQQAQLVAHVRRLFPSGRDVAYIFRKGANGATPGVLGRSLMSIADWLRDGNPNPPMNAGELIVPNPFTGALGETADGKQSYIAQSCLAAFPHVVIEFDELPLPDQCRFWAGFIRESKLPLVALVHSGGKSIHGCVHVGCADVLTWYAKRAQLVALFAADDNHAFRADVQAMRPRTGMRLAGVTRESTGTVQRLVWQCRWADAVNRAGVIA